MSHLIRSAKCGRGCLACPAAPHCFHVRTVLSLLCLTLPSRVCQHRPCTPDDTRSAGAPYCAAARRRRRLRAQPPRDPHSYSNCTQRVNLQTCNNLTHASAGWSRPLVSAFTQDVTERAQLAGTSRAARAAGACRSWLHDRTKANVNGRLIGQRAATGARQINADLCRRGWHCVWWHCRSRGKKGDRSAKEGDGGRQMDGGWMDG